LIGILNFLTLLLSIPILLTGIWLHRQATSECERFLEKPIIILGVFLLIVSLLGFIGGCCRVTWLLWFYLFFMFLLIVVLFVFTIFAFVVTNKGAGESLSNKGYKEYRLGDYSNWLQKRVNDNGNWNRIKSCLQSGKLCTDFHSRFLNDTADKFYLQHLNALQVSFFLSFFIEFMFLMLFYLLGYYQNLNLHVIYVWDFMFLMLIAFLGYHQNWNLHVIYIWGWSFYYDWSCSSQKIRVEKSWI